MTNTIDILINAKDQATATIKKVGASIEASQISFAKMAAVGGVAFGALTGVILKSVDAAQESEKVHAQLEAVLKSTGGAVGLTAKQIEAHSAALQNNLGISDEVIASGQNMLLTFTNIGKETFPKATETLLDMATAMNGGAVPSAEALKGQAIQLGKALNDPIQGISALTRVGVTFTDQQKLNIEAMIAMGDTAGAQKIILDELGREFGGSALAQSQTFEGQMRKLKVSFDDIFENIGKALLPALQKLADFLVPLIQKIVEWTSENPKLTQTLLLIAAGVSGLALVLGTLGLILPAISAGFIAVNIAMGPIGWTIAAIVVAIGLLYTAWKTNFLGIQDITASSMAFLETTLGGGLFDLQTSIDGFITTSSSSFTTFFERLGSGWYDTWESMKSTTVTIGEAIAQAGRVAFEKLKSIVSGIVQSIEDFVRSKLQNIRDILREIVTLGQADTPTFNGVSGARASGGPVSGGSTYLVGERGPELFTPRSSGNITPNNQIGGASISINFGGVSVRNDNDINTMASMISDELTRKLQLYKLGIA